MKFLAGTIYKYIYSSSHECIVLPECIFLELIKKNKKKLGKN